MVRAATGREGNGASVAVRTLSTCDAFGHAPDEKFGDEDGAQADR